MRKRGGFASRAPGSQLTRGRAGTLWPAASRPWALEQPINTEDLQPRSGAKCRTWAGSGGRAGTRGFIGVRRAVASPALDDLSPCNKQNFPPPRKPLDLDKTPEHLLNCRLAPRLKRKEAVDGASGFLCPEAGGRDGGDHGPRGHTASSKPQPASVSASEDSKAGSSAAVQGPAGGRS